MTVMVQVFERCTMLRFLGRGAKPGETTVAGGLIGGVIEGGKGKRVKVSYQVRDRDTTIAERPGEGGAVIKKSTVGAVIVVWVPDCVDYRVLQKFRVIISVNGAKPTESGWKNDGNPWYPRDEKVGPIIFDFPQPPPELLDPAYIKEKKIATATISWQFVTCVCCEKELLAWFIWTFMLKLIFNEDGTLSDVKVLSNDPPILKELGDEQTTTEADRLKAAGIDLNTVCG